MSSSTQTKADTIWRVVVILIIVAGALFAIIAPTVTGTIASAWPGCQVVLFGILIAAIRSLRRVD